MILQPFKNSSVVPLPLESNAGPLTQKASLNQPDEGFGVLHHIKRELKSCFNYSHFRVSRVFILNVQKEKSNVQAVCTVCTRQNVPFHA